VVCVHIFCFSFPEEKICWRKKQLVQDLTPPPSIYIHMCTLYTYTNECMPRCSPSGFFGPSRCLIPATPGLTSEYPMSSGEDPRATGGLVSNLPHPWVNKTKKHPSINYACISMSLNIKLHIIILKKLTISIQLNFLFCKISFFLIDKEFPCWNWYFRKFLIFSANRVRPGSQRRIRNFLFRMWAEIILLPFIRQTWHYRFVFFASTKKSTNKTHACAVKCRPPRLFQQGKSLFPKIRNYVVWRGLNDIWFCNTTSNFSKDKTTYICLIRHTFLLYDIFMSMNFYDMSFNF